MKPRSGGSSLKLQDVGKYSFPRITLRASCCGPIRGSFQSQFSEGDRFSPVVVRLKNIWNHESTESTRMPRAKARSSQRYTCENSALSRLCVRLFERVLTGWTCRRSAAAGSTGFESDFVSSCVFCGCRPECSFESPQKSRKRTKSQPGVVVPDW